MTITIVLGNTKAYGKMFICFISSKYKQRNLIMLLMAKRQPKC